MSLTPELKHRRDSNRVRKMLRKNPDIIKSVLESCYAPDGTPRKHPASVAAKMDKASKWSGTSLLKYMVGNGFLRPAGDGYTLTRKGKAEIRTVESDPLADCPVTKDGLSLQREF